MGLSVRRCSDGYAMSIVYAFEPSQEMSSMHECVGLDLPPIYIAARYRSL